METILIASDHAGVGLKARLEAELKRRGFAVRDLGTHSTDSTDYADYAHPLALEVSEGRVKGGILLCGTGLGMSYVANRYPNVRAAVTWAPEIAELARSHNDANVLVLPARFVSEDDALAILARWIDTPFEGGRHERRVVKIERGEQKAESRPSGAGKTRGKKAGSAKRGRAKAAKPAKTKAGKTRAANTRRK